MICVSGFGLRGPPVYIGCMDGELAKKIKALRQSLGMDQTAFAEALGTTQSTVTRWEKGSKPAADKLHAIAKLGKTTVDRLLGIDDLRSQDVIPVVGYVGAGAEVFPFDDYAHGVGMDYVERPPFVEGRAISVEIRGDSLFPTAENGWKLIYAGEQRLIEEEVINRLCVVKLTDGRMLVKRIMRGSAPGRYHLSSPNAPMIEDAEVEWAARVKAIIPS